MRKFFVLLLFASFILAGCKKSDSTDPGTAPTTPPPTTPVTPKSTGKVLLPTGSSINLDQLSVINAIATSSIKNGEYIIDTSGNAFTFQFLVDGNNKSYLVKYNYPGQPDGDFSVSSTALALFMNMPIILSLKNEAKAALIPKLIVTTEFANLANEVSTLVKVGKPVTDSINAMQLAPFIEQLFNKAKTLRLAEDLLKEPLAIVRGGDAVAVTNKGVPTTYAVGQYKNGQLVKPIEVVGGYDVFPTSISDALIQLWDYVTGSVTPEPSKVEFEMMTDGQYTYKIRSGKPGLGDNSAEASKAFNYNLAKGAVSLISTYVPLIKSKKECAKVILDKVAAQAGIMYTIGTADGRSALTIAKMITEITHFGLSSVPDLLQKCGGSTMNSRFIDALSIFIPIANAVSTTFSSINIYTFAGNWYSATPTIDTCFSKTGSTYTSCKPGVVGTWKAVTLDVYGNNYFNLYDYTAYSACRVAYRTYFQATDWQIKLFSNGTFENYQTYIPGSYAQKINVSWCDNPTTDVFGGLNTFTGTYNITQFNTSKQTSVILNEVVIGGITGGNYGAFNKYLFDLTLPDDNTMILKYVYNGFVRQYTLKKQ